MIIKIKHGRDGSIRLIEGHDVRIRRMEKSTELIYQNVLLPEGHGEVHLGDGCCDHVFIMEGGNTVDHIVIEDATK